jgi:outer membrane protein OmpA-like peptidoglycan-associated protein
MSGGSRMVYRPFRSLGRFVLAACAVGLGAASLGAQTPATTTPAPGGINPSRVDIFLGYSYFGAHGRVTPAGIPYSSVDRGAIGSGAYYFNKYFGGEVVYTNHPSGANDGLQGASAGPIFRLPMNHFTLFAHGLAGGVRLGGPNSDVPATFEHEPYTWGVGLTAGGGMDYDLPWFDHRFGLRLFEADYRYNHTDFGPSATIPTGGALGGRANLDAAELSTGLLVHFGHIVPPPPISYACVASPATGYPGDPITVTGTTTNLNPKKTPTYTWTSTGGVISGPSNVANVDTKAAAAGTYTVNGHVVEGYKPGEAADCSAQFTVTAFQPPTVSCSANPTSLNPGDSSTIAATGMSPQNRPLTYSYSSTAGSISGMSSSATLSTAGASPGPITVTCNTVDDKGQSASATTTVTVIAPPPPPVVNTPTSSALGGIDFGGDKKQPTRVNNQAKAKLDDIYLELSRNPGAKLAVEGDQGSDEQKGKKSNQPSYAAERAVNTKDYLVTEKGVDPSQVMVYTGTSDGPSVKLDLIPPGAANPDANDTPVDESAVKAVPRNPVKKPMKKK